MNHIPTDYELVIQPTRGWFTLNLVEVWRYRDLLVLLVHRDFVAKYKQTILGPAWFVLQPLITTVVFSIIFGEIAQIPTDSLPPILFYLAGLLGWNYFAQTFQSTSSALVSNVGLFGKVYFPTSGRSALGRHLELLRLRTPARDPVGSMDLFQVVHCRQRAIWIVRRNRLAPSSAPADRGAQSGCRPLALRTNGEVPRLYFLDRIHHPNLDVRDACDLPPFADPGKMALGRCAEPDGDAGRGDQGYVPWPGHRDSGLHGAFGRGHGLAAALRRSRLQQGREDLRRHGLRIDGVYHVASHCRGRESLQTLQARAVQCPNHA